jgi:hypothetical protein
MAGTADSAENKLQSFESGTQPLDAAGIKREATDIRDSYDREGNPVAAGSPLDQRIEDALKRAQFVKEDHDQLMKVPPAARDVIKQEYTKAATAIANASNQAPSTDDYGRSAPSPLEASVVRNEGGGPATYKLGLDETPGDAVGHAIAAAKVLKTEVEIKFAGKPAVVVNEESRPLQVLMEVCAPAPAAPAEHVTPVHDGTGVPKTGSPAASKIAGPAPTLAIK